MKVFFERPELQYYFHGHVDKGNWLQPTHLKRVILCRFEFCHAYHFMKKKIRKIIINKINYYWKVELYPYEGRALKIWKEKQLIYYNKKIDYKIESITPSQVKKIILAV